MNVPLPPHPFEPLTELIAPEDIYFRVHEPTFPAASPGGAPVENPGTLPNPGHGKPTRFAFFGDPRVPVIYLADTPEAAVHESILRDAVPGSFIPRPSWQTKVLSAIQFTQSTEVAVFHSDGLRRFNLTAAQLTDSGPLEYPQTVRWAEAAHAAGHRGVSYMCRHFNSSRALCLFGNEVTTSLVTVVDHQATRTFSDPAAFDWLADLAGRIDVTIRP